MNQNKNHQIIIENHLLIYESSNHLTPFRFLVAGEKLRFSFNFCCHSKWCDFRRLDSKNIIDIFICKSIIDIIHTFLQIVLNFSKMSFIKYFWIESFLPHMNFNSPIAICILIHFNSHITVCISILSPYLYHPFNRMYFISPILKNFTACLWTGSILHFRFRFLHFYFIRVPLVRIHTLDFFWTRVFAPYI